MRAFALPEVNVSVESVRVGVGDGEARCGDDLGTLHLRMKIKVLEAD